MSQPHIILACFQSAGGLWAPRFPAVLGVTVRNIAATVHTQGQQELVHAGLLDPMWAAHRPRAVCAYGVALQGYAQGPREVGSEAAGCVAGTSAQRSCVCPSWPSGLGSGESFCVI